MDGTDLSVIERPYDGCGKCLFGVRRLSRVKTATSSPERRRENVLTATASVGAYIIGWADCWEASGAADPLTRPALGPWLRDEGDPYGACQTTRGSLATRCPTIMVVSSSSAWAGHRTLLAGPQ